MNRTTYTGPIDLDEKPVVPVAPVEAVAETDAVHAEAPVEDISETTPEAPVESVE